MVYFQAVAVSGHAVGVGEQREVMEGMGQEHLLVQRWRGIAWTRLQTGDRMGPTPSPTVVGPLSPLLL